MQGDDGLKKNLLTSQLAQNIRITPVVLEVNLWEIAGNFCEKVFPSTINKPRLVDIHQGHFK